MGLAGAGIAATAASAAAGLAGSAMQAGATGKAAGAAQRNLQMALPQIQENYNTSIHAYQPWSTAGQSGLGATSDLLGLNGPEAATAAMDRFRTSPGYQWQLDQGLRAVDAAAAAKGMGRSGAVLKAEQEYGQGLADQEFGNYYNRLFGLSNQGLNAAGGIASAANNLSAALEGNAQSQAGVNLAAGGAQSSIYGNAAKGIGENINTLLNNQDFQGLFGGGSGSLAGYGSEIGGTGYQTAPGLQMGSSLYGPSYWG